MGLRQRLQELLGMRQAADSYNDDEGRGYSEFVDPLSGYGDHASYHPDQPDNAMSNVIAMPGVSSFQSELVVMEPYSFQEVPAAVIALRDRKVVVLNLGNLDADEAQRSVDYVAGGTFALDGHQERIGKCVFLFTPHSVQITSQLAATMASASPPGYPPPPPPHYSGYAPPLTPEQQMLRKLNLRGNYNGPGENGTSQFDP